MPHIKRGSQPVSPSGNHCLQNPSCKASHDGTIFIYFVILKIKHHFLLIMSENGWFSLSNVALNIRTINSMIGNIFLLYIYIYLSFCFFVCLYPINALTAQLTRIKFLLNLIWTQRRFMHAQNYKKLSQKILIS